MNCLIFFLLIIHKIHCDFHCDNPVADLRITSTHQSESYHIRSKRAAQNIRITRFYDDSYNSLSNKDQITSLVLDPAVQYWQNALTVKSPLTNPLLIDNACNGVYSYMTSGTNRLKVCSTSCLTSQLCYTTPIPKQYIQQCYTRNNNEGYTASGSAGEGAANTDLLLIVTQKTDGCTGTILAYALACELEYTLDRPVIGLINICPGKIDLGIGLRMSIATVKHEIVHILGLSSNLYAFYRNQSGSPLTLRDASGLPNLGLKTVGTSQIYQYSDVTVKDYNKTFNYSTGPITQTVSYLVTPNVQNEIRTQFNCSTLEGMMLENYGTSSNALSHFEKLYLQNELMTATISINAQVSRMTFAVLQDSGWYNVNFNAAENFTYAQNLGCNFVSQSCYDYINTKQSSSQPLSPYCNQAITTPGLSCSSDMKYQTYCNLIDSSSVASPIPAQFKYFVSKTLVSTDPFGDYCPTITVYALYISSALINTGICTDPQNAAVQGTSNDYFNQGFDATSICIGFASSWFFESGASKLTTSIQGSGCYKTLCLPMYGLMLVVNNLQYQCKSKGQIIDVTSRNTYLTPHGKLTCPDCSSVCDTYICGSVNSTSSVPCNNVDRPCSGNVANTVSPPVQNLSNRLSVQTIILMPLVIFFVLVKP